MDETSDEKPIEASLRFWIFSFVSRSRSSPRHHEELPLITVDAFWMGPGKK
jgi:hypothetical protein